MTLILFKPYAKWLLDNTWIGCVFMPFHVWLFFCVVLFINFFFSHRNLNTFFIARFFGFLIQPINTHSHRINIIDKIPRNHTVMTSQIPLSMIFTYGSFFFRFCPFLYSHIGFQHEYNELICVLPFWFLLDTETASKRKKKENSIIANLRWYVEDWIT